MKSVAICAVLLLAACQTPEPTAAEQQAWAISGVTGRPVTAGSVITTAAQMKSVAPMGYAAMMLAQHQADALKQQAANGQITAAQYDEKMRALKSGDDLANLESDTLDEAFDKNLDGSQVALTQADVEGRAVAVRLYDRGMARMRAVTEPL